MCRRPCRTPQSGYRSLVTSHPGFACLVVHPQEPHGSRIRRRHGYVRRNASTAKIDAAERVNLALSKGAETYENQELAAYTADELAGKTNSQASSAR